ncbi:hypothetical protein OsJ_28167 [Oryza sativa Japonica Group]|uniref:Uncharacterized protein n=1 Tax=Oryza sativa subsp. japonica TaxID=39947 RepID=A3BVF6_ORYSJ|nr:hypothetical protein OsJ_28167 [Oryza sativa Japonica Group]
MHRVLVAAGQDPDIAACAYEFILCSLPDLAVQSFLHPLRVYLRAQSITLPLTYAAAAALALHVPVNVLLVHGLGLGIPRRRARRRLDQPQLLAVPRGVRLLLSARPGRAARINVSAFYGVGMPAALALAFWPARLDFRGMWAGMLAAQLVCAALMLLAVRRTDWDEQAARAREITGAVAGVVVGDGDVVVKGDHADAAKVKADSGLLVVTVLS